MKIVNKNVVLKEDDADVINTTYVKIESIDGGCVLSMFNAGGNGEQLLVKTEDFPEESRTPIFWSRSGSGFILRPDAPRWRDLESYLAYNFGCRDGAVGVICKVDGELYLIFVVPILLVGLESIAAAGNESSIESLDKIIPGYTKRQNIMADRAKTDLLSEINPVDVLSDLEKQVDLLTSLVLTLADSVPKANLPEWVGSFKAMHTANSSLQFSGEQSAIAATFATKAKLRKAQARYFETRKSTK